MTVRYLTPPQLMEINRYWDKVGQILDHVLTGKRCRCGSNFAHHQEYAEHLADVLFPHRGVR